MPVLHFLMGLSVGIEFLYKVFVPWFRCDENVVIYDKIVLSRCLRIGVLHRKVRFSEPMGQWEAHVRGLG